MADLLAKQDKKTLKLFRGSEVNGEIISITDTEITLDLGGKSEGVVPVRDLTNDQAATIKVGDKLTAYVLFPETLSGQVLLTTRQGESTTKPNVNTAKFRRFLDAKASGQTLIGKGIELNKGGLVVEAGGVRGFLPTSQVNPVSAASIEDLIGKDIEVVVIEADSLNNRLIFTQKVKVSDEIKQKIAQLKTGTTVTGKVSSVLPFGVFVTLEDGLEGLVHISEVAWTKTENLASVINVGQEVSAKIISTEPETGRVNLSIRQITEDPFAKIIEDFQPDDVVKGTVTSVNPEGVSLSLKDGVEGYIATEKLDPTQKYELDESYTFLVDSVDTKKRRVNLAPFLTTTDGLIYK
jgi:ribosomal protein S1